MSIHWVPSVCTVFEYYIADNIYPEAAQVVGDGAIPETSRLETIRHFNQKEIFM